MYNDLAAKTTAINPSALLAELNSKFMNLNDEQSKLLSQVEDKLHNILNKRVPVSDQKNESPDIRDFMTSASLQIDRISSANRRLEQILAHLSEII